MDFEYVFHSSGIFGYGEEGDFTYWSFAHFAPLIVLALAIFLVYRYREKLRNWKGEENFRFAIGLTLILIEFFYYCRLLYVGNGGNGKQLLTKLPFEVCEWAAILTAFMIMKKGKSLFQCSFYICLTLGVIPWFMPAVITDAGPTYLRYYHFWLEHTLPVFAVFYMIFVHGFRPDYKQVYKPFIFLGVLAGFAIPLNYAIPDANFMYLASGTTGNSIANVLPQSIPVRLCLFIGILCVLFALISLPQIIKQITEKKKTAPPDQT